MVIHVGFGGIIETLSTYNTETHEEETIDLPLKLSNYNDIEIYTLLGAVIAKAKNIGSVCLCLYDDISNDTRKEIFDHAKRLGINDMTIINHITAFYLGILYQQRITPQVGEYIWIQFLRVFHIWQQKEEGAQFVMTWEMEKMLENTTHLPNIFISWEREEINGEVVKEVYPNCKTYTFSNFDPSKGALIKARIMANDDIGLKLNAFNISTRSFKLLISGNVVFNTPEDSVLPLHENVEINYQPGNIFKVCYENNIDYLKLPTVERFFIDFSLNQNEIYSIRYLDVDNKILQPEENDAKMESIFAVDFSDIMLHKVEIVKNAIESVSFTSTSTEDISKKKVTLERLENLIKNLCSIENVKSFKPLKQYYLPKKILTFDPDFEAVGIDLGTTRCCAFVSRKNGIESVALDNIGQMMLPSYVTFEKGQGICGEYVAETKIRTNPKETVFDAKRLIGKKYNEITVDKSWPFQVYDDGNRILLGIKNANKEMLVPPLVVSMALLFHIKQKIDEYQGKESKEVVITTPAAFTPIQNIETVLAGIFCDWDSVNLLPEPLAAAFAYCIDRTLPINSHFLLFDFGGGTLDVALLKLAYDYIQIENMAGDSFLGGRDFDNLLINHFQKKLEEDFDILIDNDLKKYRLMTECQKLKHTLSTSLEGQINVSDLNAAKEDIIVITRTEFEAMAVHLLSRIEGEQVVAKGAAYYAYYISKHSKTSTKSDRKKKGDCTVM